ncbi:MAG: nucleotide exchange factor GrpE [Bacillota bacterium]|nr:nucleotide exchange factor GrpE [Candidatus Fermentithermobacillaceae bacterium]
MDKKPVDDSDNRPEESTCPEDMTAPAEHAEKVEAGGEPRAQVQELSARVAELEEQLEAASEEAARLTSELDTWQSKATALFDQYNRTKADFDGFRRRTERDFEDRLLREKSDFMKALLDVMDNFERFLKAAEKGIDSGDAHFDAFHKGVVMIRKQLMDVLLREGVEPIESPVGKVMNPEYHEAVAAEDGGGEHGTVIEELQTGYVYRGTVLRATRVKVIR